MFFEGTSQASCEDEVRGIGLGSCSLHCFDVGSTERPGSVAREIVKVSVCLFSWRYNPLWLYFHSPVAGFSLLVFEVS